MAGAARVFFPSRLPEQWHDSVSFSRVCSYGFGTQCFNAKELEGKPERISRIIVANLAKQICNKVCDVQCWRTELSQSCGKCPQLWLSCTHAAERHVSQIMPARR